MARWLEDEGFNYSITLKSNLSGFIPTEQSLRASLWKYAGYLDKMLIGARYHKRQNAPYRTAYVAFVEGFPAVGHIHGFMRVHERHAEKFDLMLSNGGLESIWSALVVGGTSRFDRLYDHGGWLSYSTKEVNLSNPEDRFIVI